MLEILINNWKFIVSLLGLILFASIVYMRIIKNNEIFEHFGCYDQLGMLPPKDKACQPIPMIINGQPGELRGSDISEIKSDIGSEIKDGLPPAAIELNVNRPQCSNYIINSPPISSMFNITDMCHTNNKKEQLEWNCFYRYQIEKNILSDPKWANNLYSRDYPIFYKV
jgi:hypothetical protein